jgi:hypothetical protein
MNNQQYNNEPIQVTNAIPVERDENNYIIIPSRSSLRNLINERVQHERIIIVTKNYIRLFVNMIILLLSLPFIIADIVIINNYYYSRNIDNCILKRINLNNKNNSTYILFSLGDYLIVDILLSAVILLILLYIINIEFQEKFSLRIYRDTLYATIIIIIFQIIWIILGVLTIIDKELINICSTNIYTFTYANIVTRGILLFALTSIIINNYYIL